MAGSAQGGGQEKNDVLRAHLDDFVLEFLDDILAYLNSIEDHADHLRKVFTKLREHHPFCKASKCEILTPTVEFLGNQITPQEMTAREEKLRAMKE